MRRIWSLLRTNILALLKDPYLIFFDLLFPLAILIFFLRLRAPQAGDQTVDLYLVLREPSPVLQQTLESMRPQVRAHYQFATRESDDSVEAALKDAIARYRVPLILQFPRNWEQEIRAGRVITLQVFGSSDDPAGFGVVQSLVDKLLAATGQPQTSPVRLDFKPLEQDLSGADRVLVSTLQMVWLIVGGMHAVTQYAYLRESGLGKRLMVSPLRKHEFVLSLVIEALLVAGLVSVFLSGVAVVLYSAKVPTRPATWLTLAAAATIMVVLSASFGLLIAALAREPSYAYWGPIGLYLAIMFLSGMAFPIALFPDSLRQVANLLPTRRLNAALEAELLYGQPAMTSMGEVAVMALLALAVTMFVIPWRESRRNA